MLLLLVYGAYLYFQLQTHAEMYNAPSLKVDKRRTKVEGGDATKRLATMGAGISATMGGSAAQENPSREPEEKEEPQLSIWVAVLTLAISTAFVALCAEYMVDSIDALTTPSSGLSKTFVGLILLPIVGNAAEHATAVTVACKDKMVCLILLSPLSAVVDAHISLLKQQSDYYGSLQIKVQKLISKLSRISLLALLWAQACRSHSL